MIATACCVCGAPINRESGKRGRPRVVCRREACVRENDRRAQLRRRIRDAHLLQLARRLGLSSEVQP